MCGNAKRFAMCSESVSTFILDDVPSRLEECILDIQWPNATTTTTSQVPAARKIIRADGNRDGQSRFQTPVSDGSAARLHPHCLIISQ